MFFSRLKDEGFRWDLHMHSRASRDSMARPRSIAKHARKAGLAGFAITDHDSIGSWRDGAEAAREFGLEYVRGMEITCFDEDLRRVELIGLFIDSKIEGGYVLDVARRIRKAGGLAVVPHPFDFIRSGYGGFPRRAKHFDAIETFNARTHEQARLDRAAREARRAGLAETGGSDAHGAFEVGSGWTRTPWEGAEGLRKGIEKKRTVSGGTISSRAVHVVSTLSKLKAIPRLLGMR